MSIIWRDEMSVGNPVIDNEHKYLIALINVIEAATNCKLRNKVMKMHVSQLIIYTEEHFANEETLQENIQFPLRQEHKKEHQKLISQVKVIQEKIEKCKYHDNLDQIVQGLFEMLKDWLLNHIIWEDMKMKPYFKV